MLLRGLKAALNSRGRYAYKAPETVVDHLVVGGGVVGLAIARLLSKQLPEKATYLVERNARAGEETSSRNSEVIHAGLYYPSDSLKASLCIRGRELMYKYCAASSVPFKKCGKLVVALNHQRGYIESLHQKALKLRWPSAPASFRGTEADENMYPRHVAVPTELLSGDRARELQPDLSPDIVAALLSPETGILNSHAFMESLERDIMESEGAELAYSTRVVRVDPYDGSQRAACASDIDTKEDGWVVQTVTDDSITGETFSFLARSLINSSGLSAQLIVNSLLPADQRIPMYYARGSYAAYNGPGVADISKLIYPCPDTDKTGHAFQSLGTHLTHDMDGNIRFGPDLQWISPNGPISPISTSHSPTAEKSSPGGQSQEEFSTDEGDIDFWQSHLVPEYSQVEMMYEAVRTYLPKVELSKFRPDYVGIRPKLVPPRGGFQDFVFRRDYSDTFLRSGGSSRRNKGPMISLMGIESPGLTSSLAIAEKVVDMLSVDLSQGDVR